MEESNYNPVSELYKCSNCGSNIKYLPGTEKLQCVSCNSEFNILIESKPIIKYDFNDFKNDFKKNEKLETVHVILCNNCGAQTRFDPFIVSDSCNFCTSPLNTKETNLTRLMKPESMLPFKIDHSTSMEKYFGWIKSRWLLPNDFIKYCKNPERLNGIYIPFWIYDAETETEYEGYKYQGQGEDQTKTAVSGKITQSFSDMDLVASNSLSNKIVEELEPWDMENLISYDDKFLLGFKTECYSRDLKTGYEDAIKKIKKIIEKAVEKDIGGSDQSITKMNTSIDNVKIKHCLLPIWVSVFHYNDKLYHFVINGRTGEVSGERPISKVKMFFLKIALFLTVASLISSWLFAPFEFKILGVLLGLVLLGFLISIYFKAKDHDLKSTLINPYNRKIKPEANLP